MAEKGVSLGRILPCLLFFLSLPELYHQQGPSCPTIRRLTCIDVNQCYYESTQEVDLPGAVFGCSCNGMRLAEPPSKDMFRLAASPDVEKGLFYWLNAISDITDLQHFVISNAVSPYTEGGLDQLCVYYNHTKRAPDRRMCKDKLPYVCRKGSGMYAKYISYSWYDSRNKCIEDGGDLAFLFNHEPLSLIRNAAPATSIWIGSTMQKWKWKVKGEEIKYTHWAPEQPLGRAYLCIQWITGTGWVSVLCENTRARPLCFGSYREITESPTPPVTPVPTPPPFNIRTDSATPPPFNIRTDPATPPPFRPATPPLRPSTPALIPSATPPVSVPGTPPVTRPPIRPATPPAGFPQSSNLPITLPPRATPPHTEPSTIPPNARPVTSAASTAPPIRPLPRTPAPAPFPTLPSTIFVQTTPTIPPRNPNEIAPKSLSGSGTFSDPSMRNKLIGGIVAGLVGFLFLIILIVAITAWRRQKDPDEYGHHIEESSDEGSPSTNTYSGTINNGAALPPIVEDVEPAYSTLGRGDTDMAASAQVSSDPSYSFYGMDTSKSDAVYAQSKKARSRPHNSGFAY